MHLVIFFIGQVVMGNHTLADTRWVRIAYILDETNVKFTIPSGRDIIIVTVHIKVSLSLVGGLLGNIICHVPLCS